jgi:hypothetical protein
MRRALGKGTCQPGSRASGHGAEPGPQERVQYPQRAPQPHLGVIADGRAVSAASHLDPVDGPQQAASGAQEYLPARHQPEGLIGQGHADPKERHHEPETAADPDRAGIQLLPRQALRGPIPPHC